MNLSRFLCIAATLLLFGCSQKSGQGSASTNTSGGVVSAPVDYLKAVAKDQQSAVKTIDTTSLDKAIELFNVDKGRYPKDLNELVEQKYIAQIPSTPYGTRLVYDSQNGKVTVQNQ